MDKEKSKNGSNFKVTGNWQTWAKQIQDKFSKPKPVNFKLEKKADDDAIKPVQNSKIQEATKGAAKNIKP